MENNKVKINFARNNLDKSSSQYLKQHKDNPIHWQEWNKDVLEYAQKEDKLLFVSVGYSTCHWCHVMAKETFSDRKAADFLNQHFVAIKVDREQRPDIDAYFMNFLVSTQGNGGWPMNVFLTPEGKPFFAGTYIPAQPSFGRPGFTQVLERVYEWYRKNSSQIQPFTFSKEQEAKVDDLNTLLEIIKRGFDREYGGFGFNMKFPPYNTLIFLINYLEGNPSDEIKQIITQTLDQMAKSGLYDHLQGGFFRYSVDREWRIPHFEKMLYDQAMLMWTYSLAFQVFKKNLYKKIVEGIERCLENVFLNGDVYYSATDADTNHKEGATYLWNVQELQQILSKTEWEEFAKVYDLSEKNYLDGKLHLVKKTATFLPEIEQKLLTVRNKRPQPDTDKKIITSWNSLLGIAFLLASRYLNDKSYKDKGLKLYQKLLSKHWDGQRLTHSLVDESLQKEGFLEDYSAFLLLSTYMYEEAFEEKSLILELKKKVLSFLKENRWMESIQSTDFQAVEASQFDHPTPSSISLTEEALRRTAIILGDNNKRDLHYQTSLSSDFYNLVVYYILGNFHEIHSKEKINYISLPLNAIQLKSNKYQDCFHMTCQQFRTQNDLLEFLKKIN